MLLFALTLLLAQVTLSPAPSGACFQDADLTRAEYPKDFAPPSEVGPLNATVLVLISLEGKVEKATIYKSSGYLDFDLASIRAAKRSTGS